MPTTLILGGAGQCARQITRLLVAGEGHTVHSVIRGGNGGAKQQEQEAAIAALGATPIVQSLEEASAAELAATMRRTGADTVVWCAGAGGGDPARTQAVDRRAAITAMDAAADTGGQVSRYIVISALDVRDREKKKTTEQSGDGDGDGELATPEWYDDADRQRSDGVWKAIGPYMEAKLAADRELVTGNARRKLAYTIVRPGRLVNEPGKGTVAAGKVHLGAPISREDVAALVVECIKQDGTKGLAFDCVGGDTPIAEAVAHVAKERIDTFAGRY